VSFPNPWTVEQFEARKRLADAGPVNSPVKQHNKIYSAYDQCCSFLGTLLDDKKKDLSKGESGGGTMDLMGMQ
jgi:hypothetical protein